mgnify:CR=1 FL=1
MSTTVTVGLGSCGIAAGAGKTYDKIKALKETDHLDFELKKTSCIGMCFAEPAVEIGLPGEPSVVYGGIYPDKVAQLIESHVVGKTPVN